MREGNERLTVDVPTAAKMLGISHISLYTAIQKGEFKNVIRIGRRILVPKAALERMMGEIQEATK